MTTMAVASNAGPSIYARGNAVDSAAEPISSCMRVLSKNYAPQVVLKSTVVLASVGTCFVISAATAVGLATLAYFTPELLPKIGIASGAVGVGIIGACFLDTPMPSARAEFVRDFGGLVARWNLTSTDLRIAMDELLGDPATRSIFIKRAERTYLGLRDMRRLEDARYLLRRLQDYGRTDRAAAQVAATLANTSLDY